MAPNKLQWSHEMRHVLCMIWEDPILGRAQKKQIFDLIFQEQISQSGLSDGVPWNRLTAQWAERNKNVAKWVVICEPPRTNAEARLRSELKQQVQDVARSLDARVAPRPQQHQALPVRSQGQNNIAADQTSSLRSDHQQSTTAQGLLPLSEQAPIGHWAPETPNTSGRKRRRDEVATAVPNKRRHTSPVVLIASKNHSKVVSRATTTRWPSAANVPMTPTRTSGSVRPGRKAKPKSPKTRRDGTTINSGGDEPLNPVVSPIPRHLSQPPLPDLLFRFFEYSDRDGQDGHWSRRHCKSNVLPAVPPESSSIDPTEVYQHMDRHIPFDSPFVSTSDRLLWTVQQLITKMKSGHPNLRLSIINVKAIDPRAIFYARAFHDAIRPTYGFSNGAQHYRGDSEWLVWKNIPRQAILHTFEAKRFIDAIESNPDIARALRIDVLRQKADLNNKKVPLLRSQNILLSSTTAALAQIAIFLGINAHSPMEHVTHIVRDIVEGWALAVEKGDEQDWQSLADVFEEELCRRSPRPITLKIRVCMQAAFLAGVASGSGKANYRLKPDLLAKQQKKAALLGLASPATIIAHSLDAAKVTVLSHQKTQQKRLQSRYPPQAMRQLTSREEDEGEEEADEERVFRPGKQPFQGAFPMFADNKAEYSDAEEDEDEDIRPRVRLTCRISQQAPMTPPSVGDHDGSTFETDNEGILYEDDSEDEWS